MRASTHRAELGLGQLPVDCTVFPRQARAGCADQRGARSRDNVRVLRCRAPPDECVSHDVVAASCVFFHRAGACLQPCTRLCNSAQPHQLFGGCWRAATVRYIMTTVTTGSPRLTHHRTVGYLAAPTVPLASTGTGTVLVLCRRKVRNTVLVRVQYLP